MSGAGRTCAANHDADVTSRRLRKTRVNVRVCDSPSCCIVHLHSTDFTSFRRVLGLRAAPPMDCRVRLNIYSPPVAPWLIFEGQPSDLALAYFGTLRLEGTFHVDRLTTAEYSLVTREMAASSFARVPKSTALRLMALNPARRLQRRLTGLLPGGTVPCSALDSLGHKRDRETIL